MTKKKTYKTEQDSCIGYYIFDCYTQRKLDVFFKTALELYTYIYETCDYISIIDLFKGDNFKNPLSANYAAYDHKNYYYKKYDRSTYTIINNFGDPIPFEIIQELAFEQGFVGFRYVKRKPYIGHKTQTKNNICKYKCVKKIRARVFRRLKTKNELTKNCGADTDYKNLVRAKRNKANLPNSWDDISHNYYYVRKSWKHNSKRRKQWKPR